ncbi:MAG TPA: EamA family transporter [Methylomirabilota bacterium]|nr:EamA family transporter [Methylomirabilota bacterium]
MTSKPSALRRPGPGASWTDLGAAVYVGAVSMASGFYLWCIRLARLGAAQTGSFALLIPLFGVLGVVVFLGGPVGWSLMAWGALILAGMRLVLEPPGGRRG